MEFEFTPIDYETFDFNERNFIKIIGKTKGEKICIIDSYEPHFWAILKNKYNDKAEKIKQKIEKLKVRNAGRQTHVLKAEIHEKYFLGKKVKAIKIFIENYKDAHPIADQIDFKEIDKRREYDISPITKYLMDKEFLPLQTYKIKADKITTKEFDNAIKSINLKCFQLKEFKKSEKEFKPKILAYDIEADKFEIGKGHVLMISLYGENYKKVLTWKKCDKKQDYVECFKSEKEMLQKFTEYVKDYNPDFLVGYFSDGFDLPYLRAAAENNKLKLKLGLDNSQPKFSRGRIKRGKIFGITHIDLFQFISNIYSQYLQSETLSLNDVASELLDKEKDDFDFDKISSMQSNDWKDFFKYNLRDSEITYELTQKIMPDFFEFVKIIQEPPFEISRNSMSSNVENYILHNLKHYNEIAEKRPLHNEIGERRAKGKYEGAFVFEPVPGLYENIGMFDFTSMYGSIIVTYNLSKSTLLETKEKDSFQVDLRDTKVYFSKEKGFFPEMLENFIQKRKKYKKEYNQNKNPITKARSNAYKLLANAAYGYQGFFGARYYCREAAAATAKQAKNSIHNAINKIKEHGHKIIYSDTDSIAFLLEDKTQKQTKEFLKKINSDLPGIMELELEDFYKRGLFVLKRGGKGGAKKKYALLDQKDELKIRGFETVRRDWCKLARELQSNVIEKILKNGDEKKALKILKKTVEKLKQREIDIKELTIKTQLKKPISEYVSKGPHVIAAEKMESKGLAVSPGSLIEYYVAESKQKKKLVREKVKLPGEEGEYEIDYYLNNQIIPAVENIFEVFEVNLKAIAEGKRQTGLSEF